MYKAISDYGIIGDLHCVALVGKDGSIDWCCLPSVDFPSVFGALLDARKGGRFRICTREESRQQQMYLPDTNVLITRFLSPEGVGEITDFMPIAAGTGQHENSHPYEIIRGVKAVRGQVAFTHVGVITSALNLNQALEAGPGRAIHLSAPTDP